MSGLVLDGISKHFGSVAAVEQIDLNVPQGTFVCLLGPSGCGKTTLLRMIAGLEVPSAGRILIEGADITPIPTHRRDFGMVFQSLALFPHLDVGQNIAYPLRIRGSAKTSRMRGSKSCWIWFNCPALRAALCPSCPAGSASVSRSPVRYRSRRRLFLLDEPLSALDAKLREAMQVELRQLQQRLGITTIVVTHDQREAMTMADLVVVMANGRVRQAASPIEIYRRPADAFVADFIGSTNLLPVETGTDGVAHVPGGTIPSLRLPAGAARSMLSIRPESVSLVDPEQASIIGRVTFVRDLGASVETYIEAGGTRLIAVAPPRERHRFAAGDSVGVVLPPEACVVLPA